MLGGATEAAKIVTWPVSVGRYGGTVCGRSVYAATIRRRQYLATVLSLMVRAICNESSNLTIENFKDSCSSQINCSSRLDFRAQLIINQSINLPIKKNYNVDEEQLITLTLSSSPISDNFREGRVNCVSGGETQLRLLIFFSTLSAVSKIQTIS